MSYMLRCSQIHFAVRFTPTHSLATVITIFGRQPLFSLFRVCNRVKRKTYTECIITYVQYIHYTFIICVGVLYLNKTKLHGGEYLILYTTNTEYWLIYFKCIILVMYGMYILYSVYAMQNICMCIL